MLIMMLFVCNDLVSNGYFSYSKLKSHAIQACVVEFKLTDSLPTCHTMVRSQRCRSQTGTVDTMLLDFRVVFILEL